MLPSPKRSRSGCDPLVRIYARCGSSPLSTLGIDDHRGAVEIHDHRNALLRARRERPRGSRAAEQRDEFAALHSITSSARNRKVSGIMRLIAFAVLRLMISSNFAGRRTGSSAGFSPLRIRPT